MNRIRRSPAAATGVRQTCTHLFNGRYLPTLMTPANWLLFAPQSWRPVPSSLRTFRPRGICFPLPSQADAARGYLPHVTRRMYVTANQPIRCRNWVFRRVQTTPEQSLSENEEEWPSRSRSSMVFSCPARFSPISSPPPRRIVLLRPSRNNRATRQHTIFNANARKYA